MPNKVVVSFLPIRFWNGFFIAPHFLFLDLGFFIYPERSRRIILSEVEGLLEDKMKERIRTVTFLTREQIDYLDKIGKDALFYQGAKLSRVEILSQLVDLLKTLKIDVRSMDLKKENLAQKMLKMMGPRLEFETEHREEIKAPVPRELKDEK